MAFGYIPQTSALKDLFLRLVGWPSLIRRVQAPILMRMLSINSGDVVLDAGCGPGFFTFEIAQRCRLSIGVDWRLRSNPGIRQERIKAIYIQSDIQALPFTDEKFDKILLSSVLQMVKDDAGLLKECHRILKANGRLILSVPTEYICLKNLNFKKAELRDKFGSIGKGYYDYNEILELLRKENYKIEETEYSPKLWGSFLFEIGLFLWYHFNFPFFNIFLFPFLYPFVWFDRFASKYQKGNEIIIKASKAY